jgi:CheY-like chemotaxis protein
MQKIMVVDDTAVVRVLVKSILSRDYNIIEACNGQEAIDLSGREVPDLILMDIMMPGVDGYSACSAIKSNPMTKDIPIVMLTAVDYDLNRRLAENVGASGYITKPFGIEDLKKVIDRLLPATAAGLIK